MKKTLCVLIGLYLISGTGFAKETNYLRLQRNLASSVVRDVQVTALRPFDLAAWKDSWPFLLGFAVIFTQDERIDSYIKNNFDYNNMVYSFNWDNAAYAAWGAMYVLGGDKERKVAVELAEATADTVIIASTMKHAFGRIRPILNQGAYTFIGPNASDTYNSFPSYHITWAFSWATVLGKEYNQELLAYTIATYYTLQPYKDHNHWMSDMFFGAGMGIYLGNMIVDKSNKVGEEKKVGSDWQIWPILGDGQKGMQISASF